MMANFITGQDLRLNQLQILRFSQANDALSDAVQRGSDPLGWSRGATAVTEWLRRPTAYAWAAYESERAAAVRRRLEHRALRQAGRACSPSTAATRW